MEILLVRLPLVQPRSVELQALAVWLASEGYSPHAVETVCAYVDREGTLGGLVEAGYLEPADYPDAERAYVEAMEPACICDPAWDEYEYEPRNTPRYTTTDPDSPAGWTLLPEPYEPTERDWAEYGEYLAQLDHEQRAALAAPWADFPRPATAQERRAAIEEGIALYRALSQGA